MEQDAVGMCIAFQLQEPAQHIREDAGQPHILIIQIHIAEIVVIQGTLETMLKKYTIHIRILLCTYVHIKCII